MMTCNHPKQIVCGVVRCGTCYEKWLLTAPDRNRVPSGGTGKVEWTPVKFVGYGRNVK